MGIIPDNKIRDMLVLMRMLICNNRQFDNMTLVTKACLSLILRNIVHADMETHVSKYLLESFNSENVIKEK